MKQMVWVFSSDSAPPQLARNVRYLCGGSILTRPPCGATVC
jgi:hypothetical protein